MNEEKWLCLARRAFAWCLGFCRLRAGRRMLRRWRHRSFGIQQTFLTWSQPQFNERSWIRYCLRLPTVIGLVLSQRRLRRIIPLPRRLALHVFLFDERLLNLFGARGINRFLSTDLFRFFALLFWLGATGTSRALGAGRRCVFGCAGRGKACKQAERSQHPHNTRQFSPVSHPHSGLPQSVPLDRNTNPAELLLPWSRNRDPSTSLHRVNH